MQLTALPPVTIELTPEQQDLLFYAAGVSKPPITIPAARLCALTLAAVAAGSDALPLSRSESTIRKMLESAVANEQSHSPFIVRLPLTEVQQEEMRRVTGQRMTAMLLAPDEWHVDYHETWEWSAEPRVNGHSFAVVPPHADAARTPPDRLILLPGAGASAGVFGTGNHNATRLALALLERYVEAGHRVLDIGTGTGILAVAAARLGAREVWATDIDPAAVRAARECAEINGFGGVIRVAQGTVDPELGEFDLVVANVFPPVLLALASGLAPVVRTGGVVLASGMVNARATGVIATFGRAGYALEERRVRSSWTALAFRRGSPDGPM